MRPVKTFITYNCSPLKHFEPKSKVAEGLKRWIDGQRSIRTWKIETGAPNRRKIPKEKTPTAICDPPHSTRTLFIELWSSGTRSVLIQRFDNAFFIRGIRYLLLDGCDMGAYRVSRFASFESFMFRFASIQSELVLKCERFLPWIRERGEECNFRLMWNLRIDFVISFYEWFCFSSRRFFCGSETGEKI